MPSPSLTGRDDVGTARVRSLEILQAARNLIADPEKWTKGANARDASGDDISSKFSDARCFCIYGAIFRFSETTDESWNAVRFVDEVVRPDAVNFNDKSTTTHTDVIAALDKAIANAALSQAKPEAER